MRKTLCTGLAALLLGALAACTSSKSVSSGMVYNMGERVVLGKLIYTVMDTEWLDQLGDEVNPRIPQHRFLAVRMSITNSGASPSAIPTMILSSASGATYAELTSGEGLGGWLGYLRSIKPAETERGRVLFDVPTGAYRLRLVDDSDPENERLAQVEIPVQLPPTLPRPQPAGLPAK